MNEWMNEWLMNEWFIYFIHICKEWGLIFVVMLDTYTGVGGTWLCLWWHHWCCRMIDLVCLKWYVSFLKKCAVQIAEGTTLMIYFCVMKIIIILPYCWEWWVWRFNLYLNGFQHGKVLFEEEYWRDIYLYDGSNNYFTILSRLIYVDLKFVF